jgi:hypothetical protein
MVSIKVELRIQQPCAAMVTAQALEEHGVMVRLGEDEQAENGEPAVFLGHEASPWRRWLGSSRVDIQRLLAVLEGAAERQRYAKPGEHGGRLRCSA